MAAALWLQAAAILLPKYRLAEKTHPGTRARCAAHSPGYVPQRKFAPAARNNPEKSNLRFRGFDGA